MIAALGMYDPPALHRANDRFWQAIRAHLGYGPETLTRDKPPMDIWQSPDLLFAQTCGMPLRTFLHPDVTLIGTGLKPGYYHSVLVVHADAKGTTPADFNGGRFAYNEAMSQSGWAAPMTLLDQAGVNFATLIETGGHAASALAVAEGRADLAGLDVLTWTLLGEHDPALTGQLRVIATTPATPTLPYITARGRDPTAIAAAARTAIARLGEDDRQALHLIGLVDIPLADYLAVATPLEPKFR